MNFRILAKLEFDFPIDINNTVIWNESMYFNHEGQLIPFDFYKTNLFNKQTEDNKVSCHIEFYNLEFDYAEHIYSTLQIKDTENLKKFIYNALKKNPVIYDFLIETEDENDGVSIKVSDMIAYFDDEKIQLRNAM